MSDPQPAARIILLTPAGMDDVRWLASEVYREHVQVVYAADDVPNTGPVETLAEDLGVPCRSGHGLLHDGSEGLTSIADRHRGETVVVVRGGAETEPVIMVVGDDGTSVHAIDDDS
jgi:hypothetical protein